MPEGHRVECHCTGLSTARALDRLLEGTGLGYVELGSQVVVVPLAKPEIPGADGRIRGPAGDLATLAGIVRDSVSLEPAAFARVTVTPAGGEAVADHLAIGSLSGAIDIATRDGSRDRLRTAGSVGLVSSRFSVEGPIGGSASYLVGARHTHPGVLLQLAALGLEKTGDFEDDIRYNVPNDVRDYSFGDLYAKVTSDPGGVRRFSVSGYLNSERMDDFGDKLKLGSAAFSAHYRDRLGAGGIVDATLGHSRFAGNLLSDDTTVFGDGSTSETTAGGWPPIRASRSGCGAGFRPGAASASTASRDSRPPLPSSPS